jgi:hypothetical protein
MRMRDRRGLLRFVVGGAAALVLAASLAASPAGAVVTRNQVATALFEDERPTVSAAIDNSSGPSSGDVYRAAGSFGSEIFKLTATGASTGVTINGAETPQESLQLFGFGAGKAEGIHFAQIAVDSSAGVNSGDLFVADIGHGVVDKFSESGQYLCQITGTAAPPLSECNGVAGSKTPAGSMIPSGVAVGANGDVYVSDAGHNAIDVFGAGGEYITQYADPEEEPGSLAINAAGDLYVANGPTFEPTGVVELSTEKGGSVVPAPELEAAKVGVLAVDRSTGEVIASPAGGGAIADFEASGTEVATFGEGSSGLAINEARNQIYAKTIFGPEMIVYGPLVFAPNEVRTAAASEIGEEVVTLHGHVVPDSRSGGEITECFFEYGPTTKYGKTAPCEQAVPQPAGGEVTAKATGLSPSSTYHFRLVATDAGNATYGAGSAHGADEALTTSGPASIEGEDATAVAKTASVRAHIDPFGFATACQVQYVDEASFNASGYAHATTLPCAPAALEAGFAAKSVSASLTGLSVDTTYHYRFVTTNASKAKTTDGADETFVTFGIKSFSMEALGPGGEVKYHETGGLNRGSGGYFRYEGPADTQAGGHPYALNVDFELNTTKLPVLFGKGEAQADANPKTVITELPPGLIGNATVLPRCTPGQLAAEECQGDTQVGVLTVLQEGYQAELGEPGLYNIVPPAGVPVEFGANIGKATIVYITSNVRTGGDYGVISVSNNSSTNVGVTGVAVELWGTPADPSHDARRKCPVLGTVEGGPCSAGIEPKPFLSNPTSCSGPQTAKLRIDSWQAPGEFTEATATMPAITGCNKLTFDPSISVLPDTGATDSPSGALVKLHVPQNESNQGLTVPSLRNAVVTLPQGVTLNPAAANGLSACSEAEFGLHNANPPACPDSSKVGAIEIETPLLFDRLIGSAYLAEQNNNPFHSTFALYVAAQGDGSLVKVAGKVEPNPLTGQLVSSFEENPDVPFSDFRLHFFGGPRAPLATPKVCGTYTTSSLLMPWSAPESGPAPEPSMPFQITTGPGGGPCSTPGFAPTFTAGTTSNQAGGFSPFTLTMGRGDGEQNLGGISTVLPPGLTGELSNVPLCGEPQAREGTCPASSEIGHVTTGVGAGPFPLFVPGPGTPVDPVYLTGPYKGAPFGLSVVVRAEAGPFNLDENGRPVVVRAKIAIDPITAQVTVTSDPLPQILQGVPLDIRAVNVVIERAGGAPFMVNPTSCEPMRIVANLTSGLGTPATLMSPLRASSSAPFQVTNCAALSFKPQFSVSTSGKTSRANGASLHVKLSYPKAALDTQANIGKVKVDLPKQLPSRLTTLQKACAVAQFDSNPAGCPAASRIGSAKATTPLIPVPLEGPVFFVSHAGEKFPELVIVLSGYGVTVDLHSETFINQAGVTSSTFKSIPDVPVGTFELTLPQGPYSALAANGNLCALTRTVRVKKKVTVNSKNTGKHTVTRKVKQTVPGSLVMPTAFIAQNGAVIHQNTPIEVTGCTKTKAKKTAGKAKRG